MTFLLTLLRPLAAVVFWVMNRFQQLYRRLPRWYFFALGDVTLVVAFELFVVRPGEKGEEIFLIKRPANDPVWPNLWHFPGTIGRLMDSYEVVDRRLAEELGVDALPGTGKLVDTAFLTTPRGKHIQIIRRLDVPENTEFPSGTFYPIDSCPADTIDYEARQIGQYLSSGVGDS